MGKFDDPGVSLVEGVRTMSIRLWRVEPLRAQLST